MCRLTHDQQAQLSVERTLRQAGNRSEMRINNNNNNNSGAGAADSLHWAGGLHQRRNFNKQRDPLVNWTEVLFRN